MLTTLADILRGCEPGRVQSVGLMQVLPLLSTEETGPVTSPKALTVGTSHYGTLLFENPLNEVAIVPRDAGFLTGKSSQDHAMPVVGIIPGGMTRKFENAACIQETTGGMIKGKFEMIILPFLLREAALMTRERQEYSKLWNVIKRFNTAMGLRSSGHVDVFLNAFSSQLDQFVAEFEPVPRQVGAIFLVNGHVVGIERVPTYEYWLEIWQPLVRVCYGSLALYMRKHVENIPDTRVPLGQDFDDLAGLEEALRQATEGEDESAKAIVRELMQEPLEEKVETGVDGDVVSSLVSPHFAGQIVRRAGLVIYASILATQARLRQERSAVKAFAL